MLNSDGFANQLAFQLTRNGPAQLALTDNDIADGLADEMWLDAAFGCFNFWQFWRHGVNGSLRRLINR